MEIPFVRVWMKSPVSVFRYDGSATLRNTQSWHQIIQDVAGGCHRGHRNLTFRYGEECR